MQISDTKSGKPDKVRNKRMQGVEIDDLIKPVITIRQLDAQGREVSRQTANNTLTFAALDLLVNALLRSGPSQVTHLYARFGDSGANPGYLAPPSHDIRNTNRSTFLTVNPGDTVRGGLWVPVLSAPIQDSSDPARYIGNRATYFFRIPYNIAADQTSPSGNFHVDTSYIYALGLAVAFDTGDRTQDRILSVMQAYGYDTDPELGNFTKFQVTPGGQTAIDYALPIKFRT